jgi:hypothetical protein
MHLWFNILRLPKETKFLLISLEKIILNFFPKTALEFLFRISISVIGRIPPVYAYVGLGTEFCSEKFHGIDSERFPLFRGRKCSFRGIPSSAEEPIPKLGTEKI